MEKRTGKKVLTNMYQLFLGELDDVSRVKITKLDDIIKKYSDQLQKEGGWNVTRLYLFTVRGIPNMLKPSSSTVVCRVERDIDGFHSKKAKPNSYTLEVANSIEKQLLSKKGKELDVLHKAMLMKDDIIYNRRYILKNPEHEAMVEMIRQTLGYNNPEATILPPKEPEITK